MNHYGVKLGNKHSYYDFGLIMQSVTIGLPKPKIEKVSVPGKDGDIDVSTALAGRICYGNRDIAISFILPFNPSDWLRKTSIISNYIHGKNIKIIFDSDREFYYEGICSVETFESSEKKTNVVIKCDAKPYKIKIYPQEAKTQVFGYTALTLQNLAMETIPDINVSVDMNIEFKGKTYQLRAGNNRINEIKFDEGENILKVTGNGLIEIKYRVGEI